MEEEAIETHTGEEHVVRILPSLHSDYCNYTWESARVLAWHIAQDPAAAVADAPAQDASGCGRPLSRHAAVTATSPLPGSSLPASPLPGSLLPAPTLPASALPASALALPASTSPSPVSPPPLASASPATDGALPLEGKVVVELGCGTALPGLLAARLGATVVLTDADKAADALERARLAAAANKVADRVSVVPWTWGEWTEDVLALPNPDLVLASDCLYALSDYEDFFCAASWLLHKPSQPRLLLAYRDRVAGRSMQPFLWRWQLTCRELGLDALPSHIKEDAQGLIRLYEIRAMHT